VQSPAPANIATGDAQKESLMRKTLLAAMVCLLGSLAAFASPPSRVVYVRCGKLIYDAEKPAISSAIVVITNGKVTSVGRDIAVPAGAEQIDLSSFTVLPGFVDAHIHIWAGAFGQPVSEPLAALRGSKAMSYALSSGVVGARVMATQGFIDVALKDAIEEGTIPGPHLRMRSPFQGGTAISMRSRPTCRWTISTRPCTDSSIRLLMRRRLCICNLSMERG
jgi:hypothetical protein